MNFKAPVILSGAFKFCDRAITQQFWPTETPWDLCFFAGALKPQHLLLGLFTQAVLNA